MRLLLRSEGFWEWCAQRLNLAPVPVAQAFYGMMGSRTLMAGVRLGVLGALSQAPQRAEGLAAELGLHPEGCQRLLDALGSLGVVTARGGTFALHRRARPWFDPASPRYVGGFLEFNYAQWEWWSSLEEAVRAGGRGAALHQLSADDPRWREYQQAMLELARLAAPEVARALRLPSGARTLLDLGGGHGWYSVELCRRHPGLSAEVVDLAPSVAVGRRLLEARAPGAPVRFREGDVRRGPWGGPFDAALCFQLLHHVAGELRLQVLRDLHQTLAPGGTLAVLEYTAPAPGRATDAAGLLGLHFHLTSSASALSAGELGEALEQSGFRLQRRVQVRRLPLQTLFLAERRL